MDDESAQCYECGALMHGILDMKLRIYCEACVDRLDLRKPSDYRSPIPLIVLHLASND